MSNHDYNEIIEEINEYADNPEILMEYIRELVENPQNDVKIRSAVYADDRLTACDAGEYNYCALAVLAQY